jgi:carbon monoxide dehydrogenase subunit G
MQFEGTQEFPLGPAEIASKLADARFLVDCIPGRESVAKAEPDEAVCVIRPGFAFVRGTLTITVRVTERAGDDAIKLSLHSKGIGSSSTVLAALHLTASSSGTSLRWTAEVQELSGLLKAVPKGLIRGAAQKTINDLLENVGARLR